MVTEAVNSLLQFSTGLEIPRPPCLTGNANMERSKSDTFLLPRINIVQYRFTTPQYTW